MPKKYSKNKSRKIKSQKNKNIKRNKSSKNKYRSRKQYNKKVLKGGTRHFIIRESTLEIFKKKFSELLDNLHINNENIQEFTFKFTAKDINNNLITINLYDDGKYFNINNLLFELSSGQGLGPYFINNQNTIEVKIKINKVADQNW